MGPMGPMMGGGPWGSGVLSWPGQMLLVLFILALGLVALALWRRDGRVRRRPLLPEEMLRERYAAGEITRQQYQEALVDVLKGRYVLGELDLAEYELRLGRLLGEERPLEGGKRVLDGPLATGRAGSHAAKGE
ncbi:MAG: SHOCT domain-containing protein [Chloroflexi bacterium]|nr:SHOCT domain-containing protein [Chloroflexota bacterium]